MVYPVGKVFDILLGVSNEGFGMNVFLKTGSWYLRWTLDRRVYEGGSQVEGYQGLSPEYAYYLNNRAVREGIPHDLIFYREWDEIGLLD